MRTKARPPHPTLAALSALALAACQGLPAQPAADEPVAGLSGGGQEPLDTPAARFLAWTEALPDATALPPMHGTVKFRMRGDLATFAGGDPAALDLPIGANSDVDVAFDGKMEIQSLNRMRAQLDLRVDAGMLRTENPEPLLIGLLLIADGETIWIEPDWSRAWFLDQLQLQGTGFERLVFSIGIGTVKEFMQAVAGTIEGEAAEWYRSSIECMSNPAQLSRLLAENATIESCVWRGDRVVADIAMDLSEWMPQDVPTPGFAGPLRYRCEFDAATGAVLHTSYTMDMGEGEGAVTLTFLQEMELVREPFAADRFVYALPKGRQTLPLDLFMRPAVAALQSESGKRAPQPTDDDLPF